MWTNAGAGGGEGIYESLFTGGHRDSFSGGSSSKISQSIECYRKAIWISYMECGKTGCISQKIYSLCAWEVRYSKNAGGSRAFSGWAWF